MRRLDACRGCRYCCRAKRVASYLAKRTHVPSGRICPAGGPRHVRLPLRRAWPALALLAAALAMCQARHAAWRRIGRSPRPSLRTRTTVRSSTALAAWCRNQGLDEAADCTAAWLASVRGGHGSPCFVAAVSGVDWQMAPASRRPDKTQAATETPSAESPLSRGWPRPLFRKLREAQADALYLLVNQAVVERRLSLARAAARNRARESGPQAGPQAARLRPHRRRLADSVRGATLGERLASAIWVAAEESCGPLRRGKRFYRNRWISAAEDARLHDEIDNGWVIETAHYALAPTTAWKKACGWPSGSNGCTISGRCSSPATRWATTN